MVRKLRRAAWLIAVAFGLGRAGFATAQTPTPPAPPARAGYADPAGLVKATDPYPTWARTAAPPLAGGRDRFRSAATHPGAPGHQAAAH